MTLQRAKLVTLLSRGGREIDGTEIELDFNPATLSIKIANKIESPNQQGSQRRQFVGSATSSLSFEAVFDMTRPKSAGQRRE